MSRDITEEIRDAILRVVTEKLKEKAIVTDLGVVMVDGHQVYQTQVDIHLIARVDTPIHGGEHGHLRISQDIDKDSAVMGLAAMLLGVTDDG